MRGCAAKLIASLDARFNVCGVVNPGSTAKSLIGTMKEEVNNLTMNDFLIICSGANDIDRNDSKNAVKDIVDFIKNMNHTNIILVGIPYRHDKTEHSYVNKLIKSSNNKLVKFAKLFRHVKLIEIINNRFRKMKGAA